MRFHHVLDDVLGRRSSVRLLRFLVRSGGEHSGRDLARLVGLDHKTCHDALRELAEQGVVSARRIATATAYSLKQDHPLVQGILRPAFENEETLIERYVREAQKLSGVPVESMIVFGSVARQEEVPRSDVDILVIVKDSRSKAQSEEAFAAAAGSLAAKYGSVPQFIVEERRSFRNKVVHGHPLHSNILREGRVVAGKPIEELLKDDAQEDRHSKRSSR
jgi:predicted nucleotidyltransferase